MIDQLPGGVELETERVALADGEPGVELELFRHRYPPDAACPFLPMRLPERCAVVLRGPLVRQLRRAVGRLTARCEGGTHLLPLTAGPPCQLEILPETQIFARFEVGPSLGGSAGPVLQSADLHFTPPLVIHNVAQTLGQIHRLVEDRLLAHLKPLWPRLPGWFTDLGGLALTSADVAATVLLEHVQARATGGEPLLRLCFSGRVRWFDQLELPFERVFLPATVLPVPHAALERLLSRRPLASARLVRSVHDPLGLLETLHRSVSAVEGELTAELEPPPVSVRMQTIDGTLLSAAARVPGPVTLRGGFDATVGPRGFELQSESVELAAAGGAGELLLALRGTVELDLEPGDRAPGERVELRLDADLLEGSHWPGVQLDLAGRQPLHTEEVKVPLAAQAIEASGGLAVGYSRGRLTLRPSRRLALRGRLSTDRFHLGRSRAQLDGQIEATFTGEVQPQPDGQTMARLRLDATTSSRLRGDLSPLPELNIHEGQLQGWLDAALEADLRAKLGVSPRELDFAGSSFEVVLSRLEAALDGRRLTLPAGTEVAGRVILGTFSAAGPGPGALDLRWDLRGEPCLLHHRDRAISLLSPDLRRGNLVLHLDRTGKLAFSGPSEGFYGVRYFNALLNPAGDPGYLQELLRSDDAVAHVVAALRAFNGEMAELLTDLQALWRAGQMILEREGIREPRHFVPRSAMTRIFSRLLVGNDRLRERLIPIVKQVTEGKGLDLVTTRELLQKELGEFDIDYETGFLLSWLDLVLSPAEAVEPARVDDEEPLVSSPAHADARCDLPSAAEIYEAVREGRLDQGWPATLAALAPRLTPHQLGYVLERVGPVWPDEAVARLRYVYELKRRVAELAEGYGGVEHALQPWVIACFLGEAVGPLPGINQPGSAEWPPPCALGAEEVAHLLQAGLASGWQDSRTQLNNRLLLELMQRQPATFTREVFVELGHQSPRALSGILYAFLAQDQDQMGTAPDLVAFLEEKLGAPVPRQSDYMAGGRKARESYYEALCRLADTIIEEAGPYLSAKQHLQVIRHPVAPQLQLTPSAEKLEQRARESIAKADELGGRCSFERGHRGGPRKRAETAYRRAFAACARLLQREPRAFQLSWFRDFWLRNEEALKVLSVVRGWQEDRDRDRRWLAVRTGRSDFADEQELLETVVGNFYWEVSHREAMLADPLVRLLVDPEPGRYSFTVVSCMGVITDGADGSELEHAYRRLEERRGIRVIRAPTGTARSLEYNARKIIGAIESCTTPYGLIGYSQGCANALAAESVLYGGTPDQRQLLDGLVCRNLLFSAANGSAHGTCGMTKFRRAMVLGERYLKHYQAVMSREAVQAVLRVFGGILDSPLFVAALGGAHSLTYERARALHRDEQFLEQVPTSYVRGVVTEDALPEVLEWMFYMHREQTGGREQDTQVLLTDAVGHATRVRNAYTATLERCDMGCLPQATHHWAPLSREIEFVTTERDEERAIYISPKDRLVWPWVEVNARFGRIARV